MLKGRDGKGKQHIIAYPNEETEEKRRRLAGGRMIEKLKDMEQDTVAGMEATTSAIVRGTKNNRKLS